ncbi:MAG: transglycosylase SLT domain-containing protein [Candidatus Adiutrix sp.]|jgi:soluble lytic murein transglycosylase|nr:transglycosylase SLT domain-containing protein [Candidatus Adiutrix sp.]
MRGTALLAAILLFGSELRAESSLFAPSAAEQAAPAKPAPAKPAPATPPEVAPEDLTEDDFVLPPAAPLVITVDDRGNQVIMLDGAEEVVMPNLPANEPAGWTLNAGASSPNITVDESGRKTLTLRGETPAANPAITVDESGRRSIILKEEIVSGGVETSPWHTAPSMPAAVEEPPAAPVDDRPYWIQDKPAEARPYWQKPEEAPAAPYWQVKAAEESVPYWVPEHLRKKPEAPKAPANFAPAIHDAAASPAPNTREISVYMFKDADGVVHISNVPADPRFRLFNITVVDIKVQRGLTGGRRRFTHNSLRPYIMQAASAYNLDPALIAAVIRSESAFDAGAVSWAGAQGLMQLMPQTARSVGCRDPFDPQQNIMGGSRYLRWMLDRFNGNLDLAIAAYNAGPTRVAREWKIPNIPETRNYVVIVKRNYQQYQGEF